MIDPAILPIYIATCAVALAVPGPDVVFVISTGIAHGRRPALGGAIGIAFGILAHALLAALGLSTLVATSIIAFEVLRYSGAAYLLWCAYESWTAPGIGTSTGPASPALHSRFWQGLRRGALTNLLNPKAILFAVLFWPQFVHVDHGPMFAQVLMLGAILALMAWSWFSVLALASSTCRRWLLGDPERGRRLNRLLALVFAGLAAHLLILRSGL